MASMTTFIDRHPSLYATFDRHAERAGYEHNPATDEMSARRPARRRRVHPRVRRGGRGTCNPSIVAHPVQPGNGDLAFVMSVRGIGEGHVSSIGFRTGVVCATGAIRLDTPGSFPRTGETTAGVHDRGVLHRELAELHDDHENAAYVLDALPEHFDDTQLLGRIAALRADAAIRRHTATTIAHLEDLVGCSYTVGFAADSELSERVLWPHSPTECHGMEDARFVEITDDSGPRYSRDLHGLRRRGHQAEPAHHRRLRHLRRVTDGRERGAGQGARPVPPTDRWPLRGPDPCRSRDATRSRTSDDMRCWDSTRVVQRPRRAWEVLQLGNCGSPIETSDGWLVLTHGVGPMRTYSIGAILLDLDEPHRCRRARAALPHAGPERRGLRPQRRLLVPATPARRSPRRAVRGRRPDHRHRHAVGQRTDLGNATDSHQGATMSDRSPQKPSAKKTGKSLKEKRTAKREKKAKTTSTAIR